MFRGVMTPVITTLDEKGQLDLQGMEAMIEYLIFGGMDGLLFMGSIGEFFALTKEEKRKLITFVISKVNKRVPVLIGTGGTIVEEVIELTKFAEEQGADSAVIISPYYFNLDEENLYRYYAQIASSVTLPIIIYNFPNRTTIDLSPRFIVRLVRNFPNIVGIKDTVDNISHTRQVIETVKSVAPNFSVLSGFDEYFLPNLLAGGDGVICGLTNAVPTLFSTLLRDYKQGNFVAVCAAQAKISLLMNIYDISQPFIAAIKAATALRGLPITSVVKSPGISINFEQEARIQALFDQAQIN